MRDLRNILLKGLVPKLATATGREVCTSVDQDQAYPYLYLSDIYQTETGPKTSYIYNLEVLIQVVHKGGHDMGPLYDDMDDVLSIVNNATPSITLDSPFVIQAATLVSSTTLTNLTETGTEDIGLIRINFLIV